MSTDAKKQKPPMSNKKFLAIWIPILAIIAVLILVANILLGTFGNWVASQLGTGTYTTSNSPESEDWDTTYYDADYDSIDELDTAAKDLVEQIEAEGAVLAKNDSNGLPIKSGSKVTMLGRAAADPVFGGSGSGSVDVSTAITARQGLEDAGFMVNESVYEAISTFAQENPRADIVMDKPEESTYTIGELPVTDYEALNSSFSDYSDAALVFIGRGGGEGGDLTQDMSGWDDNYEEGQHQLELNKDEKDLLKLATTNFDRVIVIVNASTTIEMGPIQNNPDIDSVLLVGSPGATGFAAVGKIIAGEINPSGRTVDLWSTDFTADPTFANFGSYIYNNIEVSYPTDALASVASNATVTTDAPFVNYQEGIYYGYRYYETAAAEGFINYDEAVIYPFGYGLSYTNFDWKVVGQDLGTVDSTITIDVEVTNTGSTAGKEVVELYYTAPYTKGGLEKSDVVLGGFEKTSTLEPGKSETVSIELKVEDMASYDYKENASWVLEAGKYELTLRTDSHSIAAGTTPISYNVSEDVIYSGENHRSSDKTEVTNQFDDVSVQFSDEATEGKVLNMSRADFKGTFPTAPTDDLYVASEEIIGGFAAYDTKTEAETNNVEKPALGADSDLTLIDVRGLPYDDPKWDELLDSLSVNDMTTMLLNGAYTTDAIMSIAKPKTTELDGPAGFSSFINASINGVAYTSEVVLAQTWNVELAKAMGTMIGNESVLKEVSGWYAPAVNLHRSPFAGRNFEYYSEDPLLSGQLATAAATGAGEKGVYTTIKHFALNDQETNRVNNGVATWANEQTIREIYLKPFEIAIKGTSMPVTYISDNNGTIEETTIGGTAVMSSFNRIGSTWAGGSPALMDTVLRQEWGFEGFSITDFNLYNYMNPNQGIAAGSDLTLSFTPSKSFSDTSSAYAVDNMRNATHNILFAVANSNAMNNLAPGTTVSYTPPTWRYIQIGVSILLGVGVVVGALLVARRVRSHKFATSDSVNHKDSATNLNDTDVVDKDA